MVTSTPPTDIVVGAVGWRVIVLNVVVCWLLEVLDQSGHHGWPPPPPDQGVDTVAVNDASRHTPPSLKRNKAVVELGTVTLLPLRVRVAVPLWLMVIWPLCMPLVFVQPGTVTP